MKKKTMNLIEYTRKKKQRQKILKYQNFFFDLDMITEINKTEEEMSDNKFDNFRRKPQNLLRNQYKEQIDTNTKSIINGDFGFPIEDEELFHTAHYSLMMPY